MTAPIAPARDLNEVIRELASRAYVLWTEEPKTNQTLDLETLESVHYGLGVILERARRKAA